MLSVLSNSTLDPFPKELKGLDSKTLPLTRSQNILRSKSPEYSQIDAEDLLKVPNSNTYNSFQILDIIINESHFESSNDTMELPDKKILLDEDPSLDINTKPKVEKQSHHSANFSLPESKTHLQRNTRKRKSICPDQEIEKRFKPFVFYKLSQNLMLLNQGLKKLKAIANDIQLLFETLFTISESNMQESIETLLNSEGESVPLRPDDIQKTLDACYEYSIELGKLGHCIYTIKDQLKKPSSISKNSTKFETNCLNESEFQQDTFHNFSTPKHIDLEDPDIKGVIAMEFAYQSLQLDNTGCVYAKHLHSAAVTLQSHARLDDLQNKNFSTISLESVERVKDTLKKLQPTLYELEFLSHFLIRFGR